MTKNINYMKSYETECDCNITFLYYTFKYVMKNVLPT